MNWYYSENNQRRGPVPQDELEQMAREGKITPDTLVWSEGMANWQPYREMFPAEVMQPSAGVPSLPGTDLPPSPVAGRDGPPWEQRGSVELGQAIVGTVKGVLFEPDQLFARMKCEGGIVNPLQYALLVGGAGMFVGSIYNIIYQKVEGYPGFSGNHAIERLHLTGSGVASELMLAIFLVPILVVLFTFIMSGLLHICLMILGGAAKSFETTFRVVCYSFGSAELFQVIPMCGWFIVIVWYAISTSVGIAKAHEISTGKAVAAVLLPLMLCCGVLVACVSLLVGLLAAASGAH